MLPSKELASSEGGIFSLKSNAWSLCAINVLAHTAMNLNSVQSNYAEFNLESF